MVETSGHGESHVFNLIPPPEDHFSWLDGGELTGFPDTLIGLELWWNELATHPHMLVRAESINIKCDNPFGFPNCEVSHGTKIPIGKLETTAVTTNL